MPPSSDPLALPRQAAPKPAPRLPDHTSTRGGPPLFPASWEWAARRRNVADRTLLYVVAIAVSLVGGLVIRALQWSAGGHTGPVGGGVFTKLDLALAPTMSVVVASAFTAAIIYAVLVRSWWSLLAAPAAFLAGVVLWHVWDVGTRAATAAIASSGRPWGYWGQVLAGEVSGEMWLLVWRCAAPAVLGAALGMLLARRGAVRQSRRSGGVGRDVLGPSHPRHATAKQ